MSPKEKAIELFDKYMGFKMNPYDDPEMRLKKGITKTNALIAVDLHLTELHKMKLIFSDRELHYKYWQEVKTEIEKI